MSGDIPTAAVSKLRNRRSSLLPSTATRGWKSTTPRQTRGRKRCPQRPQRTRLSSPALRRRMHQKLCNTTNMAASTASFHRRRRHHRQYAVFDDAYFGSFSASWHLSLSRGLWAGEWGVTSRPNPPPRGIHRVPTRRDRTTIPQRRRPDPPSKTSASPHWAGPMKIACDRFASTTQRSGIRPTRPESWSLPGTLRMQNGPSRPSPIRLLTASRRGRY